MCSMMDTRWSTLRGNITKLRDAHDEIDERNIKSHTNDIPSVKNVKNISKAWKHGPNGNKDKMKQTVRKHSATA